MSVNNELFEAQHVKYVEKNNIPTWMSREVHTS